jgi:hypothetical protein
MSVGAMYSGGTWYKFNAVMSFDVSGITDPSSITKAILTLGFDSTSGSTTQTATLARLNEDFVEAEADFDEAEDGISWTGGSGAFGNAETTQPTYTFSVGSGVSANVTIDIKDLVIDAIINDRRLLLVAAISGTPTGAASGNTDFDTTENLSNQTALVITQAARIAWSGATDGQMLTDSNWVGGTRPAADDFAMFIEDGQTSTPVIGSMVCSRIYFGKLFSQDVGSPCLLAATSVYIDTQTQLNILVLGTEVLIRNAKDINSGCRVTGVITNLYISNCSAEIIVDEDAEVSNIYVMSGNTMNPISDTYTGAESRVIIEEGADDFDIICEGSFFVTDNAECGDISLYGSGKYELNNTAEVDGIENLIIASDSVCYFNAKEIDTSLTMYGGTFTIEDNTNSQLDMPTTMTTLNGKVNLDNGLDAANAAAFDGTTFVGYAAVLLLNKTSTLTIVQ